MCDSQKTNRPHSNKQDMGKAAGYELTDEEMQQAQGGACIIPNGERMHVELDAELLPECTPLDIWDN